MKKYSGNCHCGGVKFECELESLEPTVCNCSYCAKRNAVLQIVNDFTILEGRDLLTTHRFNSMKGEHNFCRRCGIFIYSLPPVPVYPYAINLSVLNDCRWQHIEIKRFDGASL